MIKKSFTYPKHLARKMAGMDKVIYGVSTLRGHLKSRKGQTLVEYALILSLVSVLTIIVMSALGVEIQGLYLPIISALEAVQAAIS
jgi:Flp pilus assembly pilin Flp